MEINLHSIFQDFPNRHREDLIPILQQIQDEYGYLSEDIITGVGQYLGMSVNKIYGVATFYDNFRFSAVGRFHVRVCHGTACHVAGASLMINELEKILQIKAGNVDKDGLFSLEVVSCLGGCGLAPLIQVNEDFYTQVSTKDLHDIFKSLREKDEIAYEK